MKITKKNALFMVSSALCMQQADLAAMDSTTVTWGAAAICGIAGYQARKSINDYCIKKNLFPERSLPTLSQEKMRNITPETGAIVVATIAQDAEFNKDMGNLVDDTTTNVLSFLADIMFPRSATVKLNVFFFVNSFNFCSSACTVIAGAAHWWSTLTKPKAFMTGAYVGSAVASVIIPEEFYHRPWIQAVTSNFLTRSYLRNQLLKFLSQEENHTFNRNLADLFELSLKSYYTA
jgi:hypothetical protein